MSFISEDGHAKGVKYPFRSTHTLLWKSCQRDNAFANTMKGSKKRTAETASSNMMHSNSNHFETSKVDTADTYRLSTDRRSLEKVNVLSTQQLMCIEFIKNEIILSRCARYTTGNVLHLGGLPGTGRTATITSLIEDLADANMTGKGAVLLCSKTNTAKSIMFSSCVDQSTPGKDVGYMVESKFITINSGFAILVIKNSADTEDVMIQSYINNLSRKFNSNICLSDMIVMDEYTMTNINEILFIDCLLRASRGKPNGVYAVSNKRPRTSSSWTPLEAAVEDSSSMDGLDLFDDSDFEELMTEMLDVHERPLTTFAVRIDKIRSAN
ncbi:hypothetical protein O3P69_002241 [Scylla paramamosain]|uniref:Uncharacterized protein n=1 Tax=Scylla paramamosain TaxID=85552 RepID=A0AAW0V5E1_SCYPA